MLTKEQIQDIVNRWFAGRNAIDKASAFRMAMKVAISTRDNVLRTVAKDLADAPPKC